MCEWGKTTIVKLSKPDGRGHLNAGVDECLAPLVQALNDKGFHTLASCCGHGKRPGNIVLEDRRELIIAPDFETARIVDAAFPPINEVDG